MRVLFVLFSALALICAAVLAHPTWRSSGRHYGGLRSLIDAPYNAPPCPEGYAWIPESQQCKEIWPPDDYDGSSPRPRKAFSGGHYGGLRSLIDAPYNAPPCPEGYAWIPESQQCKEIWPPDDYDGSSPRPRKAFSGGHYGGLRSLIDAPYNAPPCPEGYAWIPESQQCKEIWPPDDYDGSSPRPRKAFSGGHYGGLRSLIDAPYNAPPCPEGYAWIPESQQCKEIWPPDDYDGSSPRPRKAFSGGHYGGLRSLIDAPYNAPPCPEGYAWIPESQQCKEIWPPDDYDGSSPRPRKAFSGGHYGGLRSLIDAPYNAPPCPEGYAWIPESQQCKEIWPPDDYDGSSPRPRKAFSGGHYGGLRSLIDAPYNAPPCPEGYAWIPESQQCKEIWPPDDYDGSSPRPRKASSGRYYGGLRLLIDAP